MPAVGEVDREALAGGQPRPTNRRRVAPPARPFNADAHAAMRWRAALGASLLLAVVAATLTVFDAARGASVAAGRDARLRIDPNLATRDELMLLPGVGPAVADAILEYRHERGDQHVFSRAEDLASVRRIGSKRVEQLRPWLIFAEGAEVRE